MPRPQSPPGPRNRFPLDLVIQLRRDTLGFLTRTARQWGDFVPFNATQWTYILINDPELIRDILVTQADAFIKGPALRRAKATLGEGLLTSENPLHRRQRRLAQPALHPHRVATYADDMVRITEHAMSGWRSGQVLDIHERMMGITLRIVASTLFGVDVESDVQRLGGAMDVMVNMFGRAMSPWGPLLNRLPLPSNFRFRRAKDVLDGTLAKFIQERRVHGVDGRNDLLSVLVRATDAGDDNGARPAPSGNGHGPWVSLRRSGTGCAGAASNAGETPAPQSQTNPPGHGMSDAQLRDECYTLFTAGHETTANALTFAWYLLASHPECEAKLRAELAAVLNGRAPTMADLDALPYTRACVSEAMRLYPPAWAVARQATRDVALAGGKHTLPKDGVALMSQWVTHRDPPLVAGPGPLRSAAVPRRGARPAPPLRLLPFRRRPAKLHRRSVRLGRGHARPRHHRPEMDHAPADATETAAPPPHHHPPPGRARARDAAAIGEIGPASKAPNRRRGYNRHVLCMSPPDPPAGNGQVGLVGGGSVQQAG